jgi:hypothetical protein
MDVNVKMRPVDTIPGIGGRGDKREWWRGVNSSMIYLIHYKNFCKCHNVPPSQQNEKKKLLWLFCASSEF